MLTAILSASSPTDSGSPRALMNIAGRSILEWQAALMQKMGCQRIICLCDHSFDGIIKVQREVESQGCEFHAIQSSPQLLALVHPEDTIVFVLDGLWFGASLEPPLSLPTGNSSSKPILTLPSDHILVRDMPDDFERIDIKRHWAGVAIISGAQAQKLADLPIGGNIMSQMLRLALQAGGKMEPLSDNQCKHWLVINDEASRQSQEQDVLDQAMARPSWRAPLIACALILARRFALWGITYGAKIPSAAGLFSLAIGVCLGVLGYAIAGLLLSAAGAFLCTLTAFWRELTSVIHETGNRKKDIIFKISTDILSTLTLIASVSYYSLEASVISLAILAIAISRILANDPKTLGREFWDDRSLHLLIFAICAGFGFLDHGLAIFTLSAIAELLKRDLRNLY